jgi:hypothetical protein
MIFFGSMIFFSGRALVCYRYLVGRADTLRCCDPTTSAHFHQRDGVSAGSAYFGLRARRPYDSDLLVAAIETHQALLGRAPRLAAADAAFYSAKNEAAAKAKGVKRVCIPNRSTKSPERKREQRKRWFRDGQKWCTGCEGRISVVKRRHGLTRCRWL